MIDFIDWTGSIKSFRNNWRLWEENETLWSTSDSHHKRTSLHKRRTQQCQCIVQLYFYSLLYMSFLRVTDLLSLRSNQTKPRKRNSTKNNSNYCRHIFFSCVQLRPFKEISYSLNQWTTNEVSSLWFIVFIPSQNNFVIVLKFKTKLELLTETQIKDAPRADEIVRVYDLVIANALEVSELESKDKLQQQQQQQQYNPHLKADLSSYKAFR